MEVIDINLDNLEPVSLSFDEPNTSSASEQPSVNFGPGVELLINDKKISANSSTKVDMEDLDNLENELNNLSQSVDNSGVTPEPTTKSLGGLGGFGDMFNFNKKEESKDIGNIDEIKPSNIGSATMESIGSTKTWDGFTKASEVPNQSTGAKLSEREKRRKKRAMIKKLDEWYEKGLIKHTSNFNMDSDFDEVEDEYETAMEDKRKKDSIKLQGWWFTTLVNSLEYANAVFDPFGLNLDGWGEQINEDIDSYEEIFAELHDKYKGGKMAPEVSLLLRLGFSGAVLNITNKALSTATPGFNDVIKQSPELMKMFSAATAQTMSQKNSGFEFVNSVLHPDEQVNTSFGVPPPPMKTREEAPPQRPGMQFTNTATRPDLAMGRGAMFKEEGVDVTNQFVNVNEPQARPEMKGPSNVDLDDLLSGLKTRNIDPSQNRNDENDSMVSVNSLRDNQNNVLPKRTRRKQKSDRNVVSLDI
tara:strand:- start:5 stop:1423 length:1419 start_codon:yes stop_codon:yes gene_type:complete